MMNTERLEILESLTRKEREAIRHYQAIVDEYDNDVDDYDLGTYDEAAARPIKDIPLKVFKALYYYGIINNDMDEEDITEAFIMPDIDELITNH